jgi:tetratricopeptide (TPR) repeat protein
MTHPRTLCLRGTAVLLAVFVLGNHADAQLDRVYTHDSNNASPGTVTESTRDGLKLKVGSTTKAFAENEIRKVSFQGDPPGLTRGRELAIDGQYEQALDELKAVEIESLPRDLIKADAAYYRLLSRANLALAGQGDRKAAIAEAMKFATTHRNSFHFFSVAKLLGDLELATKSYAKAIEFYGYLGRAPSAESKIESRYLTGVALLDQGDVEAAQQAFADVASVSVNSTEALRLKTLAKAGQAVALAKGGKGKEGLALTDELISELNPTDIEMSARIYNAQGANYEAAGDIEGAIMSYLHTHLMFSGQPGAHAEALGRLVELWPKVGRTERAAEARQELQQRYPGFAN